jgi:beta-1,4-mannooligosaccharide/beta-1,4-mannosyl-N-acetylglucosamine phosphorylase
MPPLHSAACIRRYDGNPLLTAKDMPYEALLTFNPGVARFQGRYVMVFRNDYGLHPASPHPLNTRLGLAFSDDGLHWEVQNRPFFEMCDEEICRVYDPRLTVIDGHCYMTFAVETRHGVRGGIAVTDDLEQFKMLHMTIPDNRNMVLFPERNRGKFMRLERPSPVYGRSATDRYDIWFSESPDLTYWGNHQGVLGVKNVPYANDKIGPGAPPIKTAKGWLEIFHAVDRDPTRGKNGWEPTWQRRFTAGVMLLDLENPYQVIGVSKLPLIVPEEAYEITGGFRNELIFPSGAILEESGEVKIYYGSADAVVAMASADVGDLIKLCTEK